MKEDDKDQEEIKNPASSSFIIDETQLDDLLKKYKDQLKSIKIDPNVTDKEKALTELNKTLFDDVTKAGQLLPINKVNQSPDGTFIKELQGASDISYSRIGDENGNNLTMAETKDGKIYFDEKEQGNNNFTGIVFVDRIDPKTKQLLETKDAIHYKDGEVVDFIEGNGGASRLGQLEQFRDAASQSRTVERTQTFKTELAEAVARRNAGRDQSVGPDGNSRGTQNQNQDPRNLGNRPNTPPPPLPKPAPTGPNNNVPNTQNQNQDPRNLGNRPNTPPPPPPKPAPTGPEIPPTGPVVPPVVPPINSQLDAGKKDFTQEIKDAADRINPGANIEARIKDINKTPHPNQKPLDTGQKDPTQEFKDTANRINPPGAGANIEDRMNDPNRPDHPNQGPSGAGQRDPAQDIRDAANRINPPGAGANIEDRMNNPNRPDHPNQGPRGAGQKDPAQEFKDTANRINPPGAGANIEDRMNNPNRPDHPNQGPRGAGQKDPTQEFKDAANRINPGAKIETRVQDINKTPHPNQRPLDTGQKDPTQEFKDAANRINPGAKVEDRMNDPNRPDHRNQGPRGAGQKDPAQEFKDTANRINPPGAGANIEDRMNNPNRPDHPNQGPRGAGQKDPTQEFKDAANRINPGAKIETRVQDINKTPHPNQRPLDTGQKDPTQEFKDAAGRINPGAKVEDRMNDPNRPDHRNQGPHTGQQDPAQEFKDAAGRINPGANIETRVQDINKTPHPKQQTFDIENKDFTQDIKDAANRINPPGHGANIEDRIKAQKGTHAQGETGYNPDQAGFKEKLDYFKKAADEKLAQQSQKPLETSSPAPKAAAFTQIDAEKLTQQLNGIKDEIKRESVETKTTSSEPVKFSAKQESTKLDSKPIDDVLKKQFEKANEKVNNHPEAGAKPNVWQNIKDTINKNKEKNSHVPRDEKDTKSSELGANASVKDKINYYEGLSNLSKPVTPNAKPPSDKGKTP